VVTPAVDVNADMTIDSEVSRAIELDAPAMKVFEDDKSEEDDIFVGIRVEWFKTKEQR
jgi:hypothetical protein